jgi:hypothetical protein
MVQGATVAEDTFQGQQEPIPSATWSPEAIVEHIKLRNWKVERGPPWGVCVFGAEV